MNLLSTLTNSYSNLTLMDLSGEQLTMSTFQFAELLANHEIWNFSKRRYKDGYEFDFVEHLLSGVIFAGSYSLPKMYRLVNSLEDVNGIFEYQLSIGYENSEEDWVTITFTKQGNTFVVDF